MDLDFVNGRPFYMPTAARLHKQPVIGYCAVVVNAEGEVCGTPFFELDQKVRHVAQCATAHASAINAYRKRTHPEIMRAWDPELERWMSANRDAILDGRKTV